MFICYSKKREGADKTVQANPLRPLWVCYWVDALHVHLSRMLYSFKLRRSLPLLTCIVSLLFILGIYRSQNVNTQTILKEVSSLVDSMAETPQIKTVTDPTWVLEHPTIVKYMKTRPLPWVSKAIPADVMAVMEGLNAARVPQDDPDLIKMIRDYYIEPPSLLPYNLTYPNREDFSKGQTPFVDSRLGHMVRYACEP